jgi:hypothetical protein
MEADLINTLKNINLDSPIIFLIVFLAILVYNRKWMFLFMLALVFVAAWLTGDYIIKNSISYENIITLPHLIYITGGIILGFTAVISFVSFIIK